MVLRIIFCCFGGKNLDEFYVIFLVYEVLLEEFEKYLFFGFVFWVIDLGVRGWKVYVYEGWMEFFRDVNVIFLVLYILMIKIDEDRKLMFKLWIIKL